MNYYMATVKVRIIASAYESKHETKSAIEDRLASLPNKPFGVRQNGPIKIVSMRRVKRMK